MKKQFARRLRIRSVITAIANNVQHDAPVGENRSHEIYNFQKRYRHPVNMQKKLAVRTCPSEPAQQIGYRCGLSSIFNCVCKFLRRSKFVYFTVDLVCLRMGVDINAFIEMAPEGKTIECD